MDELKVLEDRVYALEYATGHALVRAMQATGHDPKGLAALLKTDAGLIGLTRDADELMLLAQPLLERWARILEAGLPLVPKDR